MTQPTKEQLEKATNLLCGGNPKPEDFLVIPKEIIEEELKRDVEYEKWLDAKDMNSEYEQDEPKED